ncbi:MAG TPA: alpha/beta hydrolase [Candidatus Limnocylindrales bacterium]|nr:alpha/beta hydrolase [Candidatus Limnocylindrales bacterium]
MIGFLWWARPQPLLPEAEAALASTPAATFETGTDGRLTWTPAGAAPATGLVLYTGGKVPPAAYAPAARSIAEHGFLVAIVPAPLNLAILDTNAADRVIEDHPEIAAWAVGGHSLGGSSAALFVDGHPGVVRGLVLWASYSSVDLSGDGLRALVSYGSRDAGAATYSDATNLEAKLGPDVTVDVIDGGNHEQMGWYTGQPNDPPATISREAQQDRVISATVALLRELGPTSS